VVLFTRQKIADFLQGLFVLPLCALFGGLVALLFQWHGAAQTACVGFFSLFPFLGALKTRQISLLVGLLFGLAVTIWAYHGLHP